MDDSRLSDSFISFIYHYMYIASGITLTLSSIVCYLMITRTPPSSRRMMRHLMVVQFFVTFNDFVLGVLLGGIPLFPAPAGFYEGILHRLGVPGQVAVTALFRGGIIAMVSTPCILLAIAYPSTAMGRRYILQELPDFAWIYSTKRAVIAFSISNNIGMVVAIYSTTTVGLAVSLFLAAYFVRHTMYLLSLHALLISTKTRALQRKLTINLATQMFLPLVVLIVPITFHGLSILTARSTPLVNNVIFCIQLMHAPLHSLILISTTPSYREAFIRMLLGLLWPWLAAMMSAAWIGAFCGSSKKKKGALPDAEPKSIAAPATPATSDNQHRPNVSSHKSRSETSTSDNKMPPQVRVEKQEEPKRPQPKIRHRRSLQPDEYVPFGDLFDEDGETGCGNEKRADVEISEVDCSDDYSILLRPNSERRGQKMLGHQSVQANGALPRELQPYDGRKNSWRDAAPRPDIPILERECPAYEREYDAVPSCKLQDGSFQLRTESKRKDGKKTRLRSLPSEEYLTTEEMKEGDE